jgi:hypothetical protein
MVIGVLLVQSDDRSETRRAEMLIIIPRDGASLYEGLKSRQEAQGQDRVILDRRAADRRGTATSDWKPERRTAERRAPISHADRALLKVLGFMVLHPDHEWAQQPMTPLEPRSSPTHMPPSRVASRLSTGATDQVTTPMADVAVIRVSNQRRRWVVQFDGRDTHALQHPRPRRRSRPRPRGERRAGPRGGTYRGRARPANPPRRPACGCDPDLSWAAQ